uniref:Catenin alpha-2 n=1 Tax=Erpetoichthys calabaricus TaxID=27687 RepID=A0A8C4XIC4_ERPCA
MPPGRLPGEVFQARLTGRRPRGRPRTCWRDYVSRLAWERLGILPEELEECPDSSCKQDLLAYLQRIALYCHQLNICSKVKAEVQNLGGELVVSGVDSAMSLIQAAKNLMNAVVQTVKASYVASTKYQKSQGIKSLNLPAVSWKMKAPEKKPLVKREKQDEGQTKVKRASQKKHVNPVQALSEFKAMDSI